MHNAVQSYANTAKISLSGRDLEAHLLLKAAAKLQAIKDKWVQSETGVEAHLLDNRRLWDGWSAIETDLSEALVYNRKLWTVFIGSVTDETSQLPKGIRENIANLGIFIFSRTVEIEASPVPVKLNALIDINRNVAAGLRGQD
ncbi:MAG: flagellar biosynthesis regulator FlaF [Pseudomonadota bacterium]